MSLTNRSTSTFTRRTDAKSKWNESETAKASSIRTLQQFTIKFEYGAMLLASVAAGDIDETVRLLREGADVNYANIDGLTSLHQACIDENFAMVKLLVDKGANIDACDNEGWTPLHAAASSRSLEIIKYLVSKGANLVAVNSEGELPIDLTEVPQIEQFLEDEINRKGLDMDEARDVEEKAMLDDAKKWKREGKIKNLVDPQGATPLHVAAAKGYVEVAKILISLGADVNCTDNDGWTPMHAAVHWKQDDMCRELAAHGASLNVLNNNGQTPLDFADDDMKPILKELSLKYKKPLSNTAAAATKTISTAKYVISKRPDKQVVGILKTAKKTTEKKAVEIPKPMLPPTSAKIPKPEVVVTESKPTPSIPPTTSIALPAKPPTVARPPPLTIIPTPTKPLIPSASDECIARPTPKEPPSPITTRSSTEAISPLRPPAKVSISTPSSPTSKAPPVSASGTKNKEDELQAQVDALEIEVLSLKSERETLLKTIDELKQRIKTLEPSKPPQTSTITTTTTPVKKSQLPSIARPPGK